MIRLKRKEIRKKKHNEKKKLQKEIEKELLECIELKPDNS